MMDFLNYLLNNQGQGGGQTPGAMGVAPSQMQPPVAQQPVIQPNTPPPAMAPPNNYMGNSAFGNIMDAVHGQQPQQDQKKGSVFSTILKLLAL